MTVILTLSIKTSTFIYAWIKLTTFFFHSSSQIYNFNKKYNIFVNYVQDLLDLYFSSYNILSAASPSPTPLFTVFVNCKLEKGTHSEVIAPFKCLCKLRLEKLDFGIYRPMHHESVLFLYKNKTLHYNRYVKTIVLKL